MRVPSRAGAGVGWYGERGNVNSAIRRSCPRCGANPNTRCIREKLGPKGRYLVEVHRERRVAQYVNV
jgi:hypothetical protein